MPRTNIWAVGILELSYDQVSEARKNGISYQNVYNRVEVHGWSIERAITTPIRKKNPVFTYQDVQEAAINGINYGAFVNRIRGLKWSVEDAKTIPLKNVIKKKKYGRLSKYERLPKTKGDKFGI